MMTTSNVMRRAKAVFVAAVLLFAVSLFQSCGPSKEAVAPPVPEKKAITSTVKILTVNARHSLKEKSDVRRLARLVKSTAAEIVAVQQIERPEEGKEGFDAVRELGKETDMYNYFGKARFFEGFDSGNALLSMYPMKGMLVHELPVGKGKVRRSLAFGEVDAGIRTVGVASTELDDQSSADRVEESSEIASFVKQYAGELIVVCGDFNESSSGKAAAKMQEEFTAANTLQESTAATSQHLYTIKDEKLRPLSSQKVKAGNGLEGLLVTVEITQ